MVINRDAFIDNYLDELNENIEAVDAGILVLKKDPENEDELNRMLRFLHTIKGSSRMLKFYHIEKIVHGLENVFKGVKEERYEISNPLVQLVFITTDYLRLGAEQIKQTRNDDLALDELLAVFNQVCANADYSLESLKQVLDKHKQAVPPTSSEPTCQTQADTPRDAEAANKAIAEYETIRIKISKTDTIIKQLNNMIIKQFQFKKENNVLNDLERAFRELMSMPPSGNGDGKNQDYLKQANDCLKLIRQLRKGFNLDLSLLERDTFELQAEILGLRMLPLELIIGSLRKMAVETALMLDKEIDFIVTGADVMIDKTILERLNDPVIHLVRNAIDHGIETPAERHRKGKPETGRLEIQCFLKSGNIIIKIRDDGKGMDYDRIRAKAIRLNPSQEDDIRAMDPENLNNFLFAPGFSTRAQVDELSGRGVGLDIVRHNIEHIKGKIALNSAPDQGCVFTLTLPLSLATVDGFFILCAREKFLIPSTFVKEVLIVDAQKKLDIINRKAIRLRDKIIPIYNLASILKEAVVPCATGKMLVMVVESLNEMIGIVVDSIIQYASLIYKPLPPGMSKLKLIQGIVFDESYNIINILYIPEIMVRLKQQRAPTSIQEDVQPHRVSQRILVVDDSYATRDIERSILELENFEVDTARDGVEGLEKLAADHFDLIVTDIRMPRMDGLEFVKRLRQQDGYQQTPVIVVTSVKDADIRQQFGSVGADAFIYKSDFERGNLVQEAKRLMKGHMNA